LAELLGAMPGRGLDPHQDYLFHKSKFPLHCLLSRIARARRIGLPSGCFGTAAVTDVAMVNETLCKVLCRNLVVLFHEMYELGIDPVFWSETKRLRGTSVFSWEETEPFVPDSYSVWKSQLQAKVFLFAKKTLGRSSPRRG